MFVAIIHQGTGKVRVEEFRIAADETAAVTAFCNEYSPPKNPADYLGYDTGWTSYQQTDPDKYWAYDFTSQGLVQVPITSISSSVEQNPKYRRPKDMLMYYGYPNSFNYPINGYDNEKVAQDMARYEMIVFGNGVGDPSHPDYANTVIIIARLKELRPDIQIFGYVATTEALADFETKVDQWETLEVYGIFVDSAGYNHGTPATNGRDAFNERVDCIHNKAYTNIAFVNAWNSDHILGTTNDPSYPNSTWNPSLHESHLGQYDYVLMESFPINTTIWTPGYEDKAEWYARAQKILDHRQTYGINVAGVGIIDNDDTAGQDLFDFGFISALMFTLQAFGTSDTGYAENSNEVDWWIRPDILSLEYTWSLDPSIQEDDNDADVYWRFMDYGKLMLDFSTGAELSSITKW